MNAEVKQKTGTPVASLVRRELAEVNGFSARGRDEVLSILDTLPLAYTKVNAIFATPERKSPGSGGIFSIHLRSLQGLR